MTQHTHWDDQGTPSGPALFRRPAVIGGLLAVVVLAAAAFFALGGSEPEIDQTITGTVDEAPAIDPTLEGLPQFEGL